MACEEFTGVPIKMQRSRSETTSNYMNTLTHWVVLMITVTYIQGAHSIQIWHTLSRFLEPLRPYTTHPITFPRNCPYQAVHIANQGITLGGASKGGWLGNP